MSVIFEKTKIVKVAEQLTGLIESGAEWGYMPLFRVLEDSGDYCKRRLRDEGEIKDFNLGYVGRFCWYLLIANATAYSLQYPKDFINYHEHDEWLEEVKPVIFNAKELLQDLKMIDYNLSTNDGNRFLAKEWEDLLDRLIRWLESGLSEN